MATIGDSTDPQGTKRPNEDPLLHCAHIFKPVIVADRPSKPCLPSTISPNDAYGIFSLFFTDNVLDTIAKNTNSYARSRGAHLPKPPSYTRKQSTWLSHWRDTSATELRAYLGVLLYRSLYSQPRRYSYWSVNINRPIHEALSSSIGRDRFAELETNLHLSDLDNEDCFDKLEPLNSQLLEICKTLWCPGSALAVDECMCRFTGRTKAKLTIPTKPIPTGIKAWVIADKGYFLHWFWHAKGEGPQGIGPIPKSLGRNKTAAVVPALLKTLPQDFSYGVTLDNLFTSTKLLTYLSSIGYGARGTARSNAGIHKDLLEFKRSDTKDIIPWGTKHWRLVANGEIVQIGWKDTGGYCLFMSNMDSGVDTIITKRRCPNETATCAKTGRVPFGDQAEKTLPRPTLTYHYNTEMNQVDQGDQKRASYPVQQRQRKAWKAMFYTLIEIIAVNSFILSASSYVPEEKKITDHFTFREALCTGLLTHAKPKADTANPAGLHQWVKIKRSQCVVCKQAAAEERRGIKGARRQVLQAISPNIASRRRDKHIPRARTGCNLCRVALCTPKGTKRCWEAFHSEANSGGWDA